MNVPRQAAPSLESVLLRDARTPAALLRGFDDIAGTDLEGNAAIDILIAAGRIIDLAPARSIDPHGVPVESLNGKMVWPAFVDMHVHLDKGHIWPRRRNPDGTFMGALEAALADRARRWTPTDLARRMDFALRCAHAHGTAAIRTHLDSDPPFDAAVWPVFAALREAWAGRIELQGVGIAMMACWRGAAGAALADMIAAHGGVLGGFVQMTPEVEGDLCRLLELAGERGLDVDLHVDESADPAARGLEHLARAVLETGFSGRVIAGHCTALALKEEDEVRRILDLVAEAGIAVCSLPLCNLYLMGREPGRTPRWRGVTLLHELAARGIEVALASDNTRDPFYAFGDLDMLEVWREGVRVGHLDHPYGDWPRAVATTPARLMRLEDAGVIARGAPADLVLFDGRSLNEMLARPESFRRVMRKGRFVDTALPAYAELDDLMR